MAQSYITDTSPTDAALEDPLRYPLQLGWDRIRAFTGGVVTSVGVTLFFDHWGDNVFFVVAVAICITIAVYPVAPTHLWYSPFLTGLGLGLLLSGTFLWLRPHDTGATGKWMIAVAVGSLLFWLLPGRRGRPLFLLTMLVAAMAGVALWSSGATIDETDHVVMRFIDSIEPSAPRLIVFAVAYTLCAMALDLREVRGGSGTCFVAATIGAGWALIAVDSAQRDVLVALLLTGALLMTAGYMAGREIVGTVGLLIGGASAVRLVDASSFAGRDVPQPDPITVYIGIMLIVFGLLLGRGAHGR